MMKLIQAMFAFGLLITGAAHAYADCTRHEKLYTFRGKDDWIGYKDKAGHVVIPPRYSIASDFTDYGYGYANGFWIGLHGEKLYEPFVYDNGPDYLSDGLMRYVQGGKVGFLNECLDVVIAARFDHADPFQKGVAVFCNGCVSVPVDAGGEYHMMQGGKWGVIDKQGRVVVPMIYSHEAAMKKADAMRAATAPE